MAKILITGGSGLIGTHLSNLLARARHTVVHLSRSADNRGSFKTYVWDLRKEKIDLAAFEGVNHVIHLAGAGVADKRWTERRKKVILNSRVDGIDLLYQVISREGINLKSFISASAIGYYGMNTGDKLLDEKSESGNDFLAEVVKAWEGRADAFSTLTDVAKVRIGVVLAREGGALPQIALPIRYFAGAPLGSGEQFMSWIHIHDLCRIFQHIVENDLTGHYNAVAPNPVTNKVFTKQVAKTLNKPLILPNVPSFVLRLFLGEMSQMVLGGNKVSGQAIQEKGFNFNFTELNHALNDLLTK